MIHDLLKSMVQSSQRETEKRAQLDLLKKLPKEDLQKLAAGMKVSHLGGNEDGLDWLEKYKGSPLLDQAVALEQQYLQAEMEAQDAKKQRRESWRADEGYYDICDQIRLQKRLLDLQLIQVQSGTASAPAAAPPPAAPEAPAQGAGAPGPVAAGVESEQPKLSAAQIGEKLASVAGTTKAPSVDPDLKKMAEAWGVELAKKDAEKLAYYYLAAHPHYYGGAYDAYDPRIGDEAERKGVVEELLGRIAQDPKNRASIEQGLVADKRSAGGVGGAIGGALLGGTTGGMLGALHSPKGALIGGLAGLGLGGLGGHALGSSHGEREGKKIVNRGYAKSSKKLAAVAPAVLGGGLKTLAGTVGDVAKKTMNTPALHGAAIGAGVGALGGAAAGLQKDEHGQRHILKGLAGGVLGAAAGGGLGAVAGNTAFHMGQNPTLGLKGGLQAGLTSTRTQLSNFGKGVQGRMMAPSVEKAMASAPVAKPAAGPGGGSLSNTQFQQANAAQAASTPASAFGRPNIQTQSMQNVHPEVQATQAAARANGPVPSIQEQIKQWNATNPGDAVPQSGKRTIPGAPSLAAVA